MQKLQPISGLLASLLVKYPNLQSLAQRAFITYLKSIHKQPDKAVFDVSKLAFEEFSASLGLPMTPVIRFLKQKKVKPMMKFETTELATGEKANHDLLVPVTERSEEQDSEDEILRQKEVPQTGGEADLPPGYIFLFFFNPKVLFINHES